MRLKRILLAIVALLWATMATYAASFAELEAHIAGGDFVSAEQAALRLDTAEAGDFFVVYVEATRRIAGGDCLSATPLLETLAVIRPGFMSAHQLLYLCDIERGDESSAAQRLDVMLALLPEGDARDVVLTLRRTLAVAAGPVFSIYGDIIPSTNANRQTAATNLNGLVIPDANRATSGVTLRGGANVSFGLFNAGNMAVSMLVRGELDYSTVTRSFAPRMTFETPVSFQRGAVTYGFAPLFGADFDSVGLERLRIGVRGFAAWQVQPGSLLSLETTAYLARYPVKTYLDGTYLEASIAHAYVLTPELTVTNKLGGALDLPDDLKRHRLTAEIMTRLDYMGHNGLVLGASATLGTRLHNMPPPLSLGPNQVDVFAVGRAEIGHQALALGPFIPMLYYQYSKQVSDNVFYDYESQDIGIRLRARM
ncbi:surface lipoprotein assembly modifier [Devosia chinhatensis]|uniref:Autotransporter domain-containing protein n=1 Tax=Devosia chinhatensis TaxID=429727 RepID=A0A0F5FM75_9HYPH|nr:surface lipoprotein assembly modifier [Devosia chinhatensis]KKB09951.1 hypothetical protein VE26_09095 [Devosia chinhatensis]